MLAEFKELFIDGLNVGSYLRDTLIQRRRPHGHVRSQRDGPALRAEPLSLFA